MSYFFLDDSKHHKHNFSISAFAICETNPQHELESIISKCGFDPASFEFKSSNRMDANPDLQLLRSELRTFIHHNCKIAVCVAADDKGIGLASLRLLQKSISHDSLRGRKHEVYFDQGLFSSRQSGEKLAAGLADLERCQLHLEQDSQTIAGIQVADLIAHTCGIMLLDRLGAIEKKIVVQESGYDDEIALGFEMWASVRYSFLSRGKLNPKDDFDIAKVDVLPWGLFIDEGVDDRVASAAKDRFGEMYLGCIH